MNLIDSISSFFNSVLYWFRDILDVSALLEGDWAQRASLFQGSSEKLYWLPYLAGAALLAALIYIIDKHPSEGKKSLKRFFHFIFPWKIIFRNSSFVDVQVFLLLSILTRTTVYTGMMAFAITMGESLGNHWVNPDLIGPANVTALEAFSTVLIIVLAVDVAEYWVHRLHHQIPILWAFHRVHHSAPTLNPLTAQRFHPFEMILENFAISLAIGVAVALSTVLFGGVDFWFVFGTNILFAIVRMTYSHLRHTHVWINFPKPICFILSSPAQHQIHHSRAERHIDKNFAEFFCFWDLIFGTLYNPEKREKFFFGLGPEQSMHRPRPHKTIFHVLFEPFLWIGRHYFPNRFPSGKRN